MEIFTHPEQRNHECWIGNISANGFLQLQFASKRLGLVAYDELGNQLPAENKLFPVFVHEREVAEKGLPEYKQSTPRRHQEEVMRWMSFCLALRNIFCKVATGHNSRALDIRN